MRIPVLAVSMALFTSAASAEVTQVPADGSAAEVMAALEAAVTEAGATIFAKVDHSAGAASVGTEMPTTQLLVFGNPALGTPAIQADPLAGLMLPLRVLVYEDGAGQTWLAYEGPEALFDGLDIPADAEVRQRMTGALNMLTGKAAGGG